MKQVDRQKQNMVERFVRSNTKIYFSKETERKFYFVTALILLCLSLISTIRWI